MENPCLALHKGCKSESHCEPTPKRSKRLVLLLMEKCRGAASLPPHARSAPVPSGNDASAIGLYT